eukprot:TRINITY_DN775870_c0_g1_i1.p1 TRINITY_DN775870_c0_g1~~TRINITY_DN775870_c0_g1_i1.p1  ORF type:complete len:209 (+),score=28.14 TRINITY_DN775870_c0_g1_i1:64-690(+)
MGAGASINAHALAFLRTQFEEATKGSRDYITIKQLWKFDAVANIDFHHLGTVFLLNKSAKGRITLSEIIEFFQFHSRFKIADETFMRGIFTKYMLDTVKIKGLSRFVDWILCCIMEDALVVTFEEMYNVEFVKLEIIEILHEFLSIELNQGIDAKALMYMMQELGEEMDVMPLKDERFDELVPLVTIERFLEGFLGGMMGMYESIQLE